MGTDIHVKVTKYNTEKNYFEELKLYRPRKENEMFEFNYETGEKVPVKDNYKSIYIDAGRDYEMFDGMKDGDDKDGYGIFPWIPIAYHSLEPELAKEIKELTNKIGFFDFYEISLAEFKLYLLQHPRVSDYDADEKKWDEYIKTGKNKPEKDNPLTSLYEEICSFCRFADGWSFGCNPLSYYKVIFFFDC